MELLIPTERLSIRSLVMSDAGAMFQYRSDPMISRYQNWEPGSLKEIQDFISSQAEMGIDTPGEWYQLGLFFCGSGKMIGDVGTHVRTHDSRQVEIGITLAREYHGRGLATEALKAVLDYLFMISNKHRIYGSVDPRNERSIALLKRVGMRQEAHFIESLWFKGAWTDDIIFAMLRREFMKGRESNSSP